MENENDKEYIRQFNLGYEMAKELDLTTPMLQGQDISKEPPDSPIHEGMFQYIRESVIIGKKNRKLSSEQNETRPDREINEGRNGKGPSL